MASAHFSLSATIYVKKFQMKYYGKRVMTVSNKALIETKISHQVQQVDRYPVYIFMDFERSEQETKANEP